jgi:endonuclease/exonuclease/phosphatase family metal-dependent hydrolase
MSHRIKGAALAVACLLPLAAPAAAPAQKKPKRDVTIMARNLYLGADLIPLATQPNQEAFEQAAAERYQTVLRNDFATRAKTIAAEIRAAKPDIIGVQEAAKWLRGPDGIKDGTQTPANDVVYDSTEVLLKELAALGQRYRVVAGRDWFDYEAPTALGFDVRLIQRDVILARRGSKVRFGRTFRGGFDEHFDPPTPVGVAQQLRGWVGVDATIRGRKFRVVTTHLEAYSPEIADNQAKQLLSEPLSSRKRISFVLGDFNSDPKDAGTDDRGAERTPNAFRSLTEGGFRNLLPRRETCCYAEDLHSTAEGLDTWIDHILVRPRGTRLRRSSRVGTAQADGLWPSDHAGIVATFRLR